MNGYDFTNILGGAISYDESGDNVVVSGTAFYETIRDGGFLGTQLVGGDGGGPEVAGNFAMYGVFDYVDSANVLASLISNPTVLMAYEIRAWDVDLDFTVNGLTGADYTESFTLNATDMPGVDYLKATYNEISPWGYTELAPGIFFDIALDPINYPGQVAMSIVISGFSGNWGDVDAMLLPGVLQGYTPNVTPGSGIRVAVIPEPATMTILALGGLLLRRKK